MGSELCIRDWAVTGVFYVLIWYSIVILILMTIESLAKWFIRIGNGNGKPDA